MRNDNLNLGVVGNCSIAALIDDRANIVWSCFPHLDDDPVFCNLIKGESSSNEEKRDDTAQGVFSVGLTDFAESEQSYIENSAVLTTILRDYRGNTVEVTDFSPRFQRYGRMYRPPTLVRRLRPAAGRPVITIRCRPLMDYGAESPQITRGSNHIRYVGAAQTIRLTTNAPATYIVDERRFLLGNTIWLILGSDEAVTQSLEDFGRDALDATLDFWHNWVRSLSIPFEWQEAVIRAAITLKLCNFEETGAIVAALTTSIPEAPNTVRNWDYRYCWIRDAYFVIRALNNLGVTRTMEDYIHFITDIVDETPNCEIQPVYGIARDALLEERISSSLQGYRAMGPVRIGNQAFQQVQHDVYGGVVLAATHAFFDRRLLRQSANDQLYERLEVIGRRAVQVFDKPDAGPWELRESSAVHTFSSIMCWAACDRLSKIATALGRLDRARAWRNEAHRLRGHILENCWNETRRSLVSRFGGDGLDASLLLCQQLGFLTADDPRFVETVDAIGRDLMRGDFLYRYIEADDFGFPQTAFTICTFWYIDALSALGRKQQARELFTLMLSRRNRHGLLSEDIDPTTGELWGNYPQTYSMVGLINSAIKLSMSWEEAS